MKCFSVVGARPELIPALPVSQALQAHHEEVLVILEPAGEAERVEHFADGLAIPTPHHTRTIPANTPASQLAQVLIQVELLLLAEKPDLVLVRGDSNAALGTALVASKLQIPLAHLGAGEHRYDTVHATANNRLLIDAISQYHFCATQQATEQLAREGKLSSAYWVGDPLLDLLRQIMPMVATRVARLADFQVGAEAYALVMLQHPLTLANPARLGQILQALNRVQEPMLLPLTPQMRQAVADLGFSLADHIRLLEPVSYLDLILLAANARLVATDSSALQREAFALLTPCLTLQEATPWMETVQTGWNKLVGADSQQMVAAWQPFSPLPAPPELFGDGTAAQRMVAILDTQFGE